MRMSLCMIVRQEEKALARCLEGIADAVEEIVIVDMGSTDRTKEIARQFTDKIYDFPWMDDFAAARNFAFSKGTGEYLLWMDAEDILPSGEKEKLLAFSPLSVLSRGYAITLSGGKPVKSTKQLEIGQKLCLRLYDGEAKCTVESLKGR